jgi:creatinine amidohydrolase
MLSSKNTTKQLSDNHMDTAIISFGSTEQFGPHLRSILMAITEAIVQGLINQGFKKFVIVTGQGGANWISPCIKHLNYKYKDVIIVFAHQNSGDSWKEVNEKAGFSGENEVHGGLSSVCTVLYLCPDLVDFSKT